MEATLTPPAIPEARVVEGSDGMLLEIDGQIVPNYDATIVPFEEGDVVTGKVVRIDKDEVLVDIGYKSEGVIPNNELSIRKSVDPNEEVELGEEVDALVLTKEDQDGRLILSKKRARFERAWRKIEGAAESGEPVNGAVIEVVKGGLIVDLGVRGFLPASLVDIRRVPNLDEYLGQTIQTKVIELNRSRNNVVLSRRAVLEEERKEQRQAILERLQPGLIIEGQISNIVDFGAFVDLDGIDGLIHISELSWSHVNHPSEVLSIGQTVEVKVLDIDRDRQRISLGLKQTQEDPWQRVVDTYHVGDELEGAVTKVVAFGAFVEILEGVEGLVHISELAQQHVENPREIVAAGRRGQGQDPRDRLRAPPALALDQAGRGPGPAAPHRGPDRRRRRPRGHAGARPVRGRLRRRSGRASRTTRSKPRPPRPPSWTRRSTRLEVDDGRRADEARGRRGGRRRGEPRRAEVVADAEAAVDEAAAEARPRRRGRAPRPPPSPRPRRPRTRPRRRRVTAPPFVGLTGGIGAGKSEALAALERLGASTISTDKVVHELYEDPEVIAAVVARWGTRSRPTVASTAPRSPAAPSSTTPSATSSRACCGRAWVRGWRSGGRPRRRDRRRAPWSSRRRCCSRRAWRATTTRRSRSWPTRRSARSAPRPAGTRRSTSAPPASSHRPKKPHERRTL